MNYKKYCISCCNYEFVIVICFFLFWMFDEQKSSRDIKKGSDSGLKEVKDTFKNIDDYLSTFEPLLFEEVKAQISQAKNEEEGIFLI